MNPKCRVCGTPSGLPIFEAEVLGRRVRYFDCAQCRYVQTEQPTWLEEAYAAAINVSDTGIMIRNRANVGIVLATLSSLGERRGTVVDCAGGYGILVRMLRDSGVDAWWSDPYCENLVARGFEHRRQAAALVTAFEAFEHFVYPAANLEELLAIGPNLLLSTELIPDPAPRPERWWYYGFEHGQHVAFFRVDTLRFLARRFGKHLVTDGRSYHLFSHRPVSERLWNWKKNLARRAGRLFGLGLQSKVWSDFEYLRTK